MAAIDSLLKLMNSEGADALIITVDDVPTLHRADDMFKLSMPSISAELATSFALEVAGPEKSDDLAKGQTIKGTYHSADGSAFAYEVRSQGQGYHLRLWPVGGGISSTVETRPKPEDHVKTRSAIGANHVEKTTPLKESVDHDASSRQQNGDLDRDVFVALSHPNSQLLSVIGRALESRASDIFFSSGNHPHIRISGAIEVLPDLITRREDILEFAGPALSEDRKAMLRSKGNVDLAVELNMEGSPRRFRVSLFYHHCGLAAALRPIRERPPSLEELNLPGDLRKLCSYPNGLVLLTGAAGSGKSTTLAALVEHINQTEARHIITLEDPIEFEHRNQRSMVHQREVGRHVESFSAGLRAALRESPDIILLGEMRDLPTIAAALTAAETGHLVLSTLHTGDVTSAIDRIIDIFPGNQQIQIRLQLASALRAVLTQFLIPSTFSPGRVPAIEKLIITNAVACQIRDGRNHQISSLIQAGGAEGMITLERSLASLVRSGKVTLTTALCYARDEQGLQKLVKGAG